jgi:hypothetical protein
MPILLKKSAAMDWAAWLFVWESGTRIFADDQNQRIFKSATSMATAAIQDDPSRRMPHSLRRRVSFEPFAIL